MAPDTSLAQACDRCHRRKTRCDKRAPSCSPCIKAHSSCTYSQRVKEPVYGQNVVDRLESRIRHLESTNRRLQAANSPAVDVALSDAEVDATSHTRGAAVAQEVAFLSTSVAGDKLFLGPTSGILFAGLVQSGVADDDGSEPGHFRSPTVQSWNPEDKEDDLPPEKLARDLVEAYLAHDHISYPFLHPAAIHAAVDYMYHGTSADRLHIHAFEAFMFNMILAIASSQASKLNWHAFPGAHTHHQRATKYLNRVLCHGGVRALQAMLLLCQFQLTNSTRESSASLWHIVGISARMCFELGLHREDLYQSDQVSEVQDSSSIPINFEDSFVRRLCFWSVFALDRVVSVTLGRPLAICREDIDVEMPQLDTADTATPSSLSGVREPGTSYHNSSIALFRHIVRYRDFCGRCLTTLHRGGKRNTQLDVDRRQLRDDLASELQSWRADTQQLGLFEMDLSTPLAEARSSFRSAAWYELLYHNGVLLLYRPSYATMSGIKDDANAHILSAAKQSITLYSYLFRCRKINFSWMVLHAVFLSGLSYIYALSGLFRAMRRQSASRPGNSAQISGVPGLVDIINDCRACSNVLVAVSERCNSQKNCHEVFDRLSDALVKDAVQATSVPQYGTPSTNAPPSMDHSEAATFNANLERVTGDDSTQLPIPSGSADAALRECFPDLQVMYDAQWYDDGIRQIGTDWFNETLGGIEYPAGDWNMTS